MIQFNLLPDVKIEFIKTRNRKRMIIMVSAIASGAALALFILLFLFVRVNQAKHLRDLDKDIKAGVSAIQKIPDLDKILTIQNQLNSLPALHDKKVVTSRTVDYMTKLTPNQATISSLDLDFDTNAMTIRGNADALLTVNKFADTLKFTDYEVNTENGNKGKAFKDVVLRSFSVSNPSQGSKISYEIALTFEPEIFRQVKDIKDDTKEPVVLTVPKIISTRSETEKPEGLFEQTTEGGNQ